MHWHWQYLVPPALAFLSVDWILMPAIQARGVTGWYLFILTSILAIAELFCWLYWAKWFRSVALVEFAKKAAKTKEIQEAIALGKEIRNEMKSKEIWTRAKNKVVDYSFGLFQKVTDENNRFVKWLKRGGAITMFLFGINPEPGTRTIGAIFCGTTGWKNGIYPLAVGNVARVAYMVGLWHIIFKFFN